MGKRANTVRPYIILVGTPLAGVREYPPGSHTLATPL